MGKQGATDSAMISRRRTMKIAGAAAVATTLAGCGGGGGGGGNGGGGNGGGGGGGDTSQWEGVSEIELGGETSGWQGQAPSPIEGEDNPTLVLFEGQQYTVTWENLDGAEHNIELRNENGEVVDDYSTELMGEEGETQSLEFEATSEMAQYVCQPHQSTMQGDIQIESGDGGGGGNETGGNESTGNESAGNESAGNESGGNESG